MQWVPWFVNRQLVGLHSHELKWATLLDVYSYLGMGRDRGRERGRKGRWMGLGAKCVVPWSLQTLGGAGVLFL